MTIANELLAQVRQAVAEAGSAILEIYANPARFETELKDDDSPLTAADKAANDILVSALKALTPDIPVLSEESAQAPWSTRQHWSRCWVVDPLDGTEPLVVPKTSLTNAATELVDVRVLELLYALPADGHSMFVGQQVDAFVPAQGDDADQGGGDEE